jgi:glycerol-3-phosphate dehydrogenase
MAVTQSNSYLRKTREELIASFATLPRVDLAIIGGGIHGASMARLAAWNGLRVALFEKGDYAQETSSRSSKMAHGGLRYLEMFDFRQVIEGVKCREELFASAPHLVYPHPFFVPNPHGKWWTNLKLKTGLTIYDCFVQQAARRHSYWSTKKSLNIAQLFTEHVRPLSGFQFFDGIMNDTRLVLDNIRHARLLGARCVNYGEVLDVQKSTGGRYVLNVKDVLQTDKNFHIEAKVVVNCAGPWVASALGPIFQDALQDRLAYSRGVHLIFSKPWDHPALLIPAGKKGQYYFVWPHPAGTLVGTTERAAEIAEMEPVPRIDEVQEILQRIERDIPHAGLSRDNLVYAFAGVRSLPLRDQTRGRSSTLSLSRKHRWVSSGPGLLSLLGGKFTSAAWTVEEGLASLWSLFEKSDRIKLLRGVPLRQSVVHQNTIEKFQKLSSAPEFSETEQFLRLGLIDTYGEALEPLVDEDNIFEPIQGDSSIRHCELRIAFEEEQAMGIDDFLARRVQREYCAGHGLESIPSIEENLLKASCRFEKQQTEKYRQRVREITQLLTAR